jgi:hypothetical protein
MSLMGKILGSTTNALTGTSILSAILVFIVTVALISSMTSLTHLPPIHWGGSLVVKRLALQAAISKYVRLVKSSMDMLD